MSFISSNISSGYPVTTLWAVYFHNVGGDEEVTKCVENDLHELGEPANVSCRFLQLDKEEVNETVDDKVNEKVYKESVEGAEDLVN